MFETYLIISLIILFILYFGSREMTSKGGETIIPFIVSLITGAIIGIVIIGSIGTMIYAFYETASSSVWANKGEVAATALLKGLLVTGIAAIAIPVFGTIGGHMSLQNSISNAKEAFGFKPIDEHSPFRKFVDENIGRLGIAKPELGTYESTTINGFATGSNKNSSLIALTTQAIEDVPEDYLKAIIAHEMGHIANQDMRRLAFAQGFRKTAFWFLFISGFQKVAMSIFALLSEAAIKSLSRAREYRADAIAAKIAGDKNMIGALETLKGDVKGAPSLRDGKYKEMFFSNLFNMNTHPTINERIDALRKAYFYGQAAKWVIK